MAQMPNGDPQKIGVLVAHRHPALVMVGFILLPLLAALYHQFVQRDRLLQRMWFGRRDPGPRSHKINLPFPHDDRSCVAPAGLLG
jgi:hypothetical protein